MPRLLSSFCFRTAGFCLLALWFLAGCGKDSAEQEADAQREKDENLIKAYVQAQGLTNAVRTSSGLYYVVTEPGSGASPTDGQLAIVHYRGYRLNGTKDGDLFDSSYLSGVPFTFRIGGGNAIKGMDEAIRLLRPGARARLIIPSYLGYGTSGSSDGSIGANAVLIFYVNLTNVQ